MIAGRQIRDNNFQSINSPLTSLFNCKCLTVIKKYNDALKILKIAPQGICETKISLHFTTFISCKNVPCSWTPVSREHQVETFSDNINSTQSTASHRVNSGTIKSSWVEDKMGWPNEGHQVYGIKDIGSRYDLTEKIRTDHYGRYSQILLDYKDVQVKE